MTAVDARAIADFGTDRYGNPFPVFFEGWKIGQQSAFLIYLTAGFLKLLPFNEVTTRLPMLFLSLLGMLAVWGIARMIFSPNTALFCLGLIAINPWHIMQSRWALDCNSFPHVFAMAFFVLIHGLKRDSRKEILGAFLLFGIAMYTYGVAYYAIGIFLLMLCLWFLLSHKASFWQTAAFVLVWLIVSSPLIAMILINQFHLSSIQTDWISIQFFPESIRKSDLLFFSDRIGPQLITNLKAIFQTLVLQRDNDIFNTLPWIGPLYLVTLPFVLLGLWLSRRKSFSVERIEGNTLVIPLLFWLIAAFSIGFVVSEVNTSRMNLIYYPALIFASIAMDWIWRKRRMLGLAVIVLYSICFLSFGNSYFRVCRKQMNEAFFNGFKMAVRYADTHFEKICVATRMPGHNYFMVPEILTQYYLPIDAPYYQGKTSAYIGTDGTKWQIPFKERFRFVDYLQDNLEQYTDCGIVSTNMFIDSYPESDYNITQFPNYFVAERK